MKKLLTFVGFVVIMFSFVIEGSASFVIKDIHLPSSFYDRDIKHIVTDNKKVLWFATDLHLYRFNGYNADLILDADGNPFEQISSLVEHRGSLWIAINGEIVQLSLDDWEFNRVELPANIATSPFYLTKGLDNEIICVTVNGGIFKINSHRAELIISLQDQLNFQGKTGKINGVEMMENGDLLASTDGIGSIFWVRKDKDRYYLNKKLNHPQISGNTINELVFDHEGNCVFHTGIQELYHLNIHTEELTIFPLDTMIVAFMAKLSKDTALVMTPNGVAFLVDVPHATITKLNASYTNSLKGKRLLSRKGVSNQLFATYEAGPETGLLLFEPCKNLINQEIANQTVANSVRSIYKHVDSNFYLGTYGEGFIRLSKNMEEKEIIHPSFYPYRIMHWNEDTLLLGCEGVGLYWFQMKQGKLTPVMGAREFADDFITSIVRANDSTLLVGSYNGLHVVKPYQKNQRKSLYHFTMRNFPHKINELKIINDQLWLATDKGLFALKINDDDFKVLEYFRFNSNDNQRYTDIEQVENLLYAATAGAGVKIINLEKNEWIDSLCKEDNLISPIVYSLTKYEDFLLAGTKHGLSVISLENKKIVNFTANDFLIHNEFNSAASWIDGKEIYLGTLNGVMGFDIKNILSQQNSFSLFLNTIVSIRENREIVNDFSPVYAEQEELKLKSKFIAHELRFGTQNGLRLHRENVLYYRFKEIDPWEIFPEDGIIYVAGMKPQKYTLEIAELNPDKSVKNQLYAKTLIVEPNFMQSQLFVLIMVLGSVLLIVSIRKYLVFQKEKEKRLRSQIAENLHDDVGSLLTGLSLQADYLQYANEDKRRDYEKKISETGRHLLLNMSDVVWGIDSKNDSADIIKRMKDYTDDIEENTDLIFEYDYPENYNPQREFVLNLEERRQVWLIFKEAITNISKHAYASHVKIEIIFLKGFWQIKIEDDGVGIEEVGKMKKGNGLRNMQMRAKKINANLLVTNVENGTELTLYKGVL